MIQDYDIDTLTMRAKINDGAIKRRAIDEIVRRFRKIVKDVNVTQPSVNLSKLFKDEVKRSTNSELIDMLAKEMTKHGAYVFKEIEKRKKELIE